jgi:purine-nucleoside/S-methyl-5'-thioadenosine phosphorylase / adenosine deaminase
VAGSADKLELIRPDWPAAPQIAAVATTRTGGHSTGCFAGLNLAEHVGDEPERVARNRRILAAELDLPEAPRWLEQVHGEQVVDAAEVSAPTAADSIISATPGQVCAVLTADCLPVLLCDRQARHVAAIHAGWRGLLAGVIEASVEAFERRRVAASNILAWLGPAIGPSAYEVGSDVWEVCSYRYPDGLSALVSGRPEHWQMDLYALARGILERAGVTAVYGGDYCTFADQRFFSHRRDGVTGRQATLIWLQ